MPSRSPAAVVFAWVVMSSSLVTADSTTPPAFAHAGVHRTALQPAGRQAGFVRLDPPSLGIHWTNRCSPARYAKRQNLMNGNGVALADYDGDGWCDVYLTSREGGNALYRNLGDWRFTNVTAQAGVAATHLIPSGALFADFNGDRLPDLHVTSFLGPDALYFNRGDGTFTNVTSQAGIATGGGATSSAAADLDGDGDLDLYVTRFAVEALLRDGSIIHTRVVGGRTVVAGPGGRRLQILNNKFYESGEPDLLFLNDGQGRFTPAVWSERFADEQGTPLSEAPADLGFNVQLRDLTGDGHPDIQVCNDFQTPDRFWVNDGQGRFRALSSRALRNMSYASMGMDAADIDRDGHLDFYTVEMLPGDPRRHLSHLVRGADPDQRRPRDPYFADSFSRSILAWNRGDGTYAEIAWYSGTAASDWSWCPLFLDVDLDGYEDLLISSGYPHDVNHLDYAGSTGRGEGRVVGDNPVDQLLRYPVLDSPNLAWRNRGDLRFEDRSAEWGFGFRTVTHGMALADLDNDGDLDVVGVAFNGPPVFCRNDSPAPRVAVRLRGSGPNTGAVGAWIELHGGPVPHQGQELLAGGRYLSSDQPQRTFACVPARGPLSLEVRWRDGRRTVVPGVEPNSLYVIDQATAPMEPARPSADPRPDSAPWFEPVPLPATARHEDPPSDEFARQPLLPWRLGFQGPGISWRDGGPDAPDEWILGAGRGSRLLRVTGTRGTRAPAWSATPLGPAAADDLLGLVRLTLAPGREVILATAARYEADGPDLHAFLLEPATGEVVQELRTTTGGSSGPAAAADLDQDGDLDVVLGGRLIPGHYPGAADAAVFRNQAGRLEYDEAASGPLRGVGMVTGLLLTDLTGDAQPELVLATEWGPVRVFRQESGRFQEVTRSLGLEAWTGLWQGLAAGDFDGDGRLDLAAGNWGQNSYQMRASDGPWSLLHADLDGDGRTTVIETFTAPGLGEVPFRYRDVLAGELPWLRASFPTHAAFAYATLPAMLGDHAATFQRVTARTLQSVVFLNRGDRFDLQPLPVPAQWTPVFGLATGDWDGDGDVDLFAAQNFFHPRDEEDRLDAGRGLVLANDGRGRFEVVDAPRSGVEILGEQRGAAVGDFDRDGRMDLAVAQNGGPLLLWRNRHAPPAWRVRLQGPPANPTAVGAQVRWVHGPDSGPVHEIRAGSGRLSQDSAVLLLGPRRPGTRVEVRWEGRTVTLPLDPDQAELEIQLRNQPVRPGR